MSRSRSWKRNGSSYRRYGAVGRVFPWENLSDEELLDWRLCDLGLRLAGTVIEERISKLYDELIQRGIHFRPHCWLAEEWFSPDGVPGIAIPFYLVHPRLARLEYRQVYEVEGGTRDWCMKILRHEAGHAIDTAYRLSRRRSWRSIFGNASLPYPDEYRPKPHSRDFVHHLGQWYAQSHPTEDFAETFAVWLKPRSRWRHDYAEWPALSKLEYVHRLMGELAGRRPDVTSRAHVDPLRTERKTLREHYAAKRERYGIGYASRLDRELFRLFEPNRGNGHLALAATFLRNHRRGLRNDVAHATGQNLYTVDQVIQEMIDRCRELRLRAGRPPRILRRETRSVLVDQTTRLLRNRHYKIAL